MGEKRKKIRRSSIIDQAWSILTEQFSCVHEVKAAIETIVAGGTGEIDGEEITTIFELHRDLAKYVDSNIIGIIPVTELFRTYQDKVELIMSSETFQMYVSDYINESAITLIKLWNRTISDYQKLENQLNAIDLVEKFQIETIKEVGEEIESFQALMGLEGMDQIRKINEALAIEGLETESIITRLEDEMTELEVKINSLTIDVDFHSLILSV